MCFFSKKIQKGISKIAVSGITLTNNEIKDITKVTWSLKNKGILLKGTTKKIVNQEKGFFVFHKLLMTAGLPLMKTLVTPSAKSVSGPLGLTAAATAS